MSTFITEPGTRLAGRYRLEDRVSDAAGGALWKAIDETLARPVAMLTFAPVFPRVYQVITAARAASRMTDSRLAQVFDVEDSGDRAYVVLEWVSGHSLDDMVASGPLEPVRAAGLVSEAAQALATAHAAGLAHLCLTPRSLRWTPGGGIKITGLGVEAALYGAYADDPAVADTQGLGRLLYAALTAHWPGDNGSYPPVTLTGAMPHSPLRRTGFAGPARSPWARSARDHEPSGASRGARQGGAVRLAHASHRRGTRGAADFAAPHRRAANGGNRRVHAAAGSLWHGQGGGSDGHHSRRRRGRHRCLDSEPQRPRPQPGGWDDAACVSCRRDHADASQGGRL